MQKCCLCGGPIKAGDRYYELLGGTYEYDSCCELDADYDGRLICSCIDKGGDVWLLST